MFRTLQPLLFSFDVEWIPDPLAAARLFNVPIETPGEREAAMYRLWEYGKATGENPRPYLKTVLCRIVSLSGVLREAGVKGGAPKLRLVTLPLRQEAPWQDQEKQILQGFFESVGGKKPQLVGYNSAQADLPILVQRAIVNGMDSRGFARRPEKPWEGADYFNTFSEQHIDLAPLLGRYNQMPSLNEMARLSGIPGKIEQTGAGVVELWLANRIPEILAYNECDALTTHLLWARFAHFIGLLDQKAYAVEQEVVKALIEELTREEGANEHLRLFLREWERLESIQPAK